LGLREHLGVDGELLRRLELYEADLLRLGRALNLVSRRDPNVEVRRLIAECLAVGRWLSGLECRLDGPWADIGPGAGFPGIVFGCLCPHQRIDLLERRQGRCDFLRRELSALQLVGSRVFEGDAATHRGPAAGYALISLKAVAPPAEALALARPHLAAGGHALLFQRPEWKAADGWREVGRWLGSEGPFDLSARAAILLLRAD
jgi:16S rRNA (guanine527-N7)-methyltransferase